MCAGFGPRRSTWRLRSSMPFYQAHPDGRRSALVLESFSAQAVPDEATAYPWRDARGNFMFQLEWLERDSPVEAAATALARELRDQFTATSGYSQVRFATGKVFT
ncbi:uncharacterized protein GGS25DRAFT_426205 [Hypoxylon fragiforme]|uniref:uncharacterized protein n=1 Tax=Hypoxylon fragiforme TaxID=63214 RepID=UPI0020C60496|nr:uncharacterized protein GGS25DRAFT_426205 [Hypoxylon fragiforme]KAI2605326.1 hypothetical protein GGS25DRAFT_426205 [Hypoxylon fragiforme]